MGDPYRWYDNPQLSLIAAALSGQGGGTVTHDSMQASRTGMFAEFQPFDYTADAVFAGTSIALDASADLVANYGTPAIKLVETGVYSFWARISAGNETDADLMQSVQLVLMDSTLANVQPFAPLTVCDRRVIPPNPVPLGGNLPRLQVGLTCAMPAGSYADLFIMNGATAATVEDIRFGIQRIG